MSPWWWSWVIIRKQADTELEQTGTYYILHLILRKKKCGFHPPPKKRLYTANEGFGARFHNPPQYFNKLGSLS